MMQVGLDFLLALKDRKEAFHQPGDARSTIVSDGFCSFRKRFLNGESEFFPGHNRKSLTYVW